jgi:hypothetical protein
MGDFSTLEDELNGKVCSFLEYIDLLNLDFAGGALPLVVWSECADCFFAKYAVERPVGSGRNAAMDREACRRILYTRWLASIWSKNTSEHPSALCGIEAIKDCHTMDFYLRCNVNGKTFEQMIHVRHISGDNYGSIRDCALQTMPFPFPIGHNDMSENNPPRVSFALLCFSKKYFFDQKPWTCECKSPRLVFAYTNERERELDLWTEQDEFHQGIFFCCPVWEDTLESPFQEFLGRMYAEIVIAHGIAELKIEYESNRSRQEYVQIDRGDYFPRRRFSV